MCVWGEGEGRYYISADCINEALRYEKVVIEFIRSTSLVVIIGRFVTVSQNVMVNRDCSIFIVGFRMIEKKITSITNFQNT